jgi:hypothetical protein
MPQQCTDGEHRPDFDKNGAPLFLMGRRVRIIGVMPDDPNPLLPIGTTGTVTWLGQWTNEHTEQIGVSWDNGSSLILLPSDPFEIDTQ